MKAKITPYYVGLVYDACLKSFWRKKALAAFLRQCKISSSFLAGWAADESKRALLDRLFEKLPTTDDGRRTILLMAKNLMEQHTFPDLEGWEGWKQKIDEAKAAVISLKDHHKKQEEEIESNEAKQTLRQDFQKQQEEISRSQQSLKKLSERLGNLSKEIGASKAGYAFQDWFYELVQFSEVESRKPYISNGRGIDGSITIEGTTYLVELKFTSEQASAPDIDSFYKKVITKADNTMGVMLSISGYSSVAIQEASSAKTPLLLLDYSHLYLILGGSMGLSDVIERIRRHASQTGEAFLPAKDF